MIIKYMLLQFMLGLEEVFVTNSFLYGIMFNINNKFNFHSIFELRRFFHFFFSSVYINTAFSLP